MREPKVGDKILVTKVADVECAPQITEVVCVEEYPKLLEIKPKVDGRNYVRYPNGRPDEHSGVADNWRFAVRKGDRLVVTKMDGEDVEPTVVTATEDEDLAHLIFTDNLEFDVLATEFDILKDEGNEDEWHFAEDYVAEHFTDVPEDAEIIAIETVEPINDICDSFNGVLNPDKEFHEPTDEELGAFGQSYAEFNAAHGGGKTLKDYTGVDITPETLGFVSDRDKTLEGITAESLAFEESVDMVEHPPHYNKYEREVIESIRGLCTPDEFRGYLKGNIIKYSARYSDKDGVRDIDKLAQYTQFLKEFEIEMEDAK